MTATLPPPEVRSLPELPEAEIDGNKYPSLGCAYGYTGDQMRTYALSAIAAKEAEVGRLRMELGKYANVFNWDVDDKGIRRVWLEPEGTSPTAYNGFESARAALTQGETK